MSTRTAEIERRTGETHVSLRLALDGRGAGERATGVGFLDHMLDLLARHGRLDLDVRVTGDLQTGAHHTVEDTGIVLGQAIDRALEATARKNSSATSSSKPARSPAGRRSKPLIAAYGRPETSIAHMARASSIGTTAWP